MAGRIPESPCPPRSHERKPFHTSIGTSKNHSRQTSDCFRRETCQANCFQLDDTHPMFHTETLCTFTAIKQKTRILRADGHTWTTPCSTYSKHLQCHCLCCMELLQNVNGYYVCDGLRCCLLGLLVAAHTAQRSHTSSYYCTCLVWLAVSVPGYGSSLRTSSSRGVY